MGRVIFWALAVILFLFAVSAVFIGALIGGGTGGRVSDFVQNFGTNPNQIGGQVIGTTARNCTGPPNARQYQALFAQAATKHLGGDQAMLLALIEQESGFNRYSVAGSSSAAGMAQFLNETARGFPEFTGGDDHNGRVWPPGNVRDRPDPQRTPDDARFDPERSIFAAAHLFRGHLKKEKINGNLFKAYFFGYHGGGNKTVGSREYEEGLRGGQLLVGRYRRIAAQFCTSATSYRILDLFKGVA